MAINRSELTISAVSNKLDFAKNNPTISTVPSRGGPITLDGYAIFDDSANYPYDLTYTPMPECFFAIKVGGATATPGQIGTLIIENIDGIAVPISVSDGETIYFKGVRILSAATFNGQSYTSAVDNCTWFGGDS